MSAELKAGFFVVLAVATISYMITRLTQNEFSFKGTRKYAAEVSDATGVISKTKLKMAGLDVGQLVSLELSGKKAKITVEVAKDVVLHSDAAVSVKSVGFLGDKYIELFPGTDSAPILPEGGMISEGIGSGGFDQLAVKTAEVLKDIKEITQTLKDSLKGTGEDETAEETRLDRILDNMEEFTAGLAALDKLGELTDRLTDSATNIRDITDKVKRGEGTLGKLISDSETADKINTLLSGVNKYVTKVDKLQIFFDVRTGALMNTGGAKSTVSLAFQPTYDKFYMAGVTAGGLRYNTSYTTTTSYTNPAEGGPKTVTEKKKEEENSLRLNLQFGKRFYDFIFRLGLFETTGGLAVDYMAMEDRLKLYGEVYRFRKGDNAQVNMGGEVHFYKPFYAWFGGDDIANKPTRNFFVGAGVRFSDQDLKTVVAAAVNAR